MPIVDAILGTALLFFGRSVYWAFVAVAGFLVGGQLADLALAQQPDWVRLLAALGAGIAGALLAMLVQRVAFALGGLFAGGYLALLVAQSFQSHGNPIPWLVVGGAIGAVIAALIMDWGIVVLSSLVGAGAIVVILAASPAISAIVYPLLVATGVVVQAMGLRRSRKVRAQPASRCV